jgi:PilZ domain
VDPHIDSDQPGLPPDSGDHAEGVNYLRRLKGETAGSVATPSNPNGGDEGPSAEQVAAMISRRQSPRLRCSGSVEFRAEGADVRTWGTLTDISLHGCHVDMNVTVPVNTRVYLVLKSCGFRIQAPGWVRNSIPSLGMGICFAEIDPAHALSLKQLLAALPGAGVSNSVPGTQKGNESPLGSVDFRALFDGVTEFFNKNPLLSRQEFEDIAKRVRRL